MIVEMIKDYTKHNEPFRGCTLRLLEGQIYEIEKNGYELIETGFAKEAEG